MWSTGFCQVLYECYLVNQPSYGRALIHFQVIAEDVEAQMLRNLATITELVTDLQAYICLILSSHSFSYPWNVLEVARALQFLWQTLLTPVIFNVEP